MKLVVWLFPSSVALTALMVLTITPSRSQVNIKLGGGIGVMSPASDFSGSTLEYYNGSRYGPQRWSKRTRLCDVQWRAQ